MPSARSKVDNTQFSTLFGTYQIFTGFGQKTTLDISGSIPTGMQNIYSTSFNFTGNTAAAAQCFIENESGLRVPFNAGPRISTVTGSFPVYQFGGGEYVLCDTRYLSGGSTLLLRLFIVNNSGVTVNLVNQTLTIYTDLYLPPYSE